MYVTALPEPAEESPSETPLVLVAHASYYISAYLVHELKHHKRFLL